MPGISAAQHDVIGQQRLAETLDDIPYFTVPFFVPELLAPLIAEKAFVGTTIGVVQMSQFHRSNHAVDDERRPQSGSQSKKQHLSAFVSAERLHCRIVDGLDWAP